MSQIKIGLTLLYLLLTTIVAAQKAQGYVYNENKEPLSQAIVTIEGTYKTTLTDENGFFQLNNLPYGEFNVSASYLGYITSKQSIKIDKNKEDFTLFFNLEFNSILNEVEVFGERHKAPEKLDIITRMPLRPSEQIQSISIISDKVIADQGALSITDAARNIPGVTLFGSYGGVRESMSTRGFRGVPILKNGVRVDSDFRTSSLMMDMQGVESIQVIKGSAAVTQGIGSDLGSAGGVINVVTKTPKFIETGEVSMRVGSWGQFRPTFDVQTVLNKQRTVAFRLNGAYERMDSYRVEISKNRSYINPSLEWKPDNKTTITLEMDYMNDNTTPDRGTVNLAYDTIYALYNMPNDKFLGFESDNVNTKNMTYAIRISREIANKLSIRTGLFGSSLKTDNVGAGTLQSIKGKPLNERARSLTRSIRDDKNYTFQVDLVGRDIFTGAIKHTFQVGFDYKMNDLMTNSYGHYERGANGNVLFKTGLPIDQIDVLEANINNVLTMPSASKFNVSQDSLWVLATPTTSESSSYGIMAQEVMTINKYIKTIIGLRYSYGTSIDNNSTGVTTGDAWNPMVGVMISPLSNINLFGSYTTTTSLRTAANKLQDGSPIGASTTRQWEMGVKSDWLKDRLRFNFTYFYIKNANLAYSAFDENGTTLDYYNLAGNLLRDGIETELSGRILNNLQVMLGYAYLNARYQDSPVYQEGSAPMNAPTHTANSWVQYVIDNGNLKGLSFGTGVYYVGKRPVNDFALTPDGHGSMTGSRPFDMKAYTTVNAQIAYTNKKVTARVLFNNIFDELGYNSYYRGGYINQIDPRNFAAILAYKF